VYILTRQCLNQRIPSIHHLQAKVGAWKKRMIQWHFTAKDARKKLRRLYPS
jgi:hypothetical protein